MDVNGLIAIIFFFTSIMVIGGSAIIGRHRERMGMIEKGMKAEDIKAMFGRSFEEPHPLTSLKWGLFWSASVWRSCSDCFCIPPTLI